MKKVFAILLVFVFVAGFVFADTATETHELRVQSDVKEKLPAFQLMYGSEYSASAAHTNDGKVAFADGNKYPTSGDPVVANTDNIFDLSVVPQAGTYSVTFAAVLVENADGYLAKTQKSFKLEFSEGDFQGVTMNGASHTVPKTISVSKATLANTVTGISGIDGPTNNAVTVNFNGKTVNTDNLVLATATYSYTPNINIDFGTYYADVKLTITTTV